MANFSIEDLKSLREQLGTGMTDTKNALVEAEGDVARATEILRLKGAKGNAKRADRSTSEGLVAARESADSVSMIVLACETDFVAKNDRFISLADKIADAVASAGSTSVDEALDVDVDGKTVRQLVEEEAAVIGEKLELAQVSTLKGDSFAVYLHRTSKDLPPQVGVTVAYTGDDAETARAVAQHIAMFAPEHITRDEVPADVVEKERALATEIATSEGKPEAALPKIVEGRLTGFFKQTVLLDQGYARDSKLSVGQVLESAGLTVTGFSRFKIGA